MEGALVEPAAVECMLLFSDGYSRVKYRHPRRGTIGLMVLQACISLGATDITVVDVIEKRLELAKKLGCCKSNQRKRRRYGCGS